MPPPSPAGTDLGRASIRSRPARQAAELWGYAEGDLDGFDPLVKACAVKFEKTGC